MEIFIERLKIGNTLLNNTRLSGTLMLKHACCRNSMHWRKREETHDKHIGQCGLP